MSVNEGFSFTSFFLNLEFTSTTFPKFGNKQDTSKACFLL